MSDDEDFVIIDNLPQHGKKAGRGNHGGPTNHGQGRGRKIISSSEISEDDMDVSIIDNPRPSVSNTRTMKHSGGSGQKHPRKPPDNVYTSDDDDGMNTNGTVPDVDEDDVSPTEAVQLPNMLVTPWGVNQGTRGTDCGRKRGRRQHRTPLPTHRHLERDYRGRNR